MKWIHIYVSRCRNWPYRPDFICNWEITCFKICNTRFRVYIQSDLLLRRETLHWSYSSLIHGTDTFFTNEETIKIIIISIPYYYHHKVHFCWEKSLYRKPNRVYIEPNNTGIISILVVGQTGAVFFLFFLDTQFSVMVSYCVTENYVY